MEANILILEEGIYAALEEAAGEPSLRDPRDWPAVATALALTAGIPTNDNDFLGTGAAGWTTDTLEAGSIDSPTSEANLRWSSA